MRFLPAILVLFVPAAFAHSEGFIAGADFSHLAFFESRGVVYRDAGVPQDGLAILKSRGLTCVRLRLFTSSAQQAQADPYNYANNLAYNLPLALRVKNAGLKLLLDFHYSDTWADPGKQSKPSAWASLTFPQLVQQIRDYSSNCIAAFQAEGALPDYVQVGNEITSGMLWPDGRVGTANDTVQWPRLAQLINAATQGIRDASGTNMPRIIIHIDRGGDWSTTKWFFDNLNQQGVSFDIIGESYYPWWHGSPSTLLNCLTNAAAQYHKPILLAETAFPWTNSYWTTNIYGLAPSPGGQLDFVGQLAQVLGHLPASSAAGIFWWGAEYQASGEVNEAGFNTASFFNAGGNVLPVADAVGQFAAPLKLTAALSNSVLTLQWPLSGTWSSVQTSTSLTALVWSPLTNVPQTTGAVYSLKLPVPNGPARFYRLFLN